MGCTTTALELAYALKSDAASSNRAVAVIDLNPSATATSALEPTYLNREIKDVLSPINPIPLRDSLSPTIWDGILVSSASRYLANRDTDMSSTGVHALRRARRSGEVNEIAAHVVIDLPQHVGPLLASGLMGGDALLIVTRATTWAAQGAEDMRYIAKRMSSKGNPELKMAGVIVTSFIPMEDSIRIIGEIEELFGSLLIAPPIPCVPGVSEAIESYHTPCQEYDSSKLSEVSRIYGNIASRLLATQREI